MSSILGRLSNLARGVLLESDPAHASDPVGEAAVEAELAQASARARGGRTPGRPATTPSAPAPPGGRTDAPKGSASAPDAPPRAPRTRTL